MEMEGALRARLLADVGVASLVAPYTPAGESPTKAIFWIDRPQASSLPAITLEPISGDYPRTHDGLEVTRDPRIQLNVWGTNYAQTKPIIQACIAALAPAATSNGIVFEPMRFEGEAAGPDRIGDTPITHHRIDLIVWHHPA